MPGIGIGIRIGGNGGESWDSYWTRQSDFWSKSRSGLTFIDEFGNDAEILPSSLKICGTNDYFTYNDAGGLDIGAGDFTIGGIMGIYADVATDQLMFGKPVINVAKEGTYEIWFQNSTKKISFTIRTSVNWFTINSNVGVGSYPHVQAQVDNTAKVIRLFINGVQQGDDVAFTGTLNAPSKPVKVAVGEEALATTLVKPASMIIGSAYIYKSLLTPTELLALRNNQHVAGAGLYWIFNNTVFAFDVSGNNLDKAVAHRTGATIASSYLAGCGYSLNNGYTLNKWDNETYPYQSAILVPSINGVARSSAVSLGSYTKFNEVAGNLTSVNSIFCGVRFPAGIMDRSDVTQFNATCRASAFYDAGDPTFWHMTELQYDTYKTYVNADQIKDFMKYDDSAVIGRHLLTEMISTTIPQTGADLIKAEGYVNTLNKTVKTLAFNTRIEWEDSSYYYNGKHYRVWSKGQTDHWDKYIYTIDEDMVTSASYLCATGCLATTDYHSMPSVIIDAAGYIYVIHEQMDGNAHGSDMLVFKSDVAGGDITGGFTQIQEITDGELCYPTLIKCNGDIFCHFRDSFGEDIVIYKLNIGTDEFDRIGIVYNAVSGGVYKTPIQSREETKWGIVFYETNSGITDGVYYAETEDGINWSNAEGTVSVDILDSEVIDVTNKSSFAVHEDSGSYDSIISENGLIINGVPHLIVYEGNQDPPASAFITVSNVYIAKFSGGIWNKYLLPYTTPFDYANKSGFNHFLTYKSGRYYLFFISSFYDTDKLNTSNVKLYTSTNLTSWIETDFAKPDYGFIFVPTAWFTPNAPADNILVWFWLNKSTYASTQLTLPYSQQLIYKF